MDFPAAFGTLFFTLVLVFVKHQISLRIYFPPYPRFFNIILGVLRYLFKSELALQTDATLQKCDAPPALVTQ